jgi:hypothetical protein
MNRTVRAGWELNITGPPLPTVTFSGPDGDVVIGIPGCGANWSHPDGRSSFELCEQQFLDGKLVPGRIWVEQEGLILTVERRHSP